MKLCGKCNQVKLETEFNKCKSKYDGLQATCSDCRKFYRELHKVEAKQYREEYKISSADKIKARNDAYYIKHKDKIKTRVSNYAKANKEKVLARNIAYLKANPEKAKTLSRKKYLAFVLKPAVLERDNFICRLCGNGSGLQIHHIIPKKLLESTDDITNLITLCKACHKDKAHKGCSRELDEDIKLYLTDLISNSL